jgi:hypothetical protein
MFVVWTWNLPKEDPPFRLFFVVLLSQPELRTHLFTPKNCRSVAALLFFLNKKHFFYVSSGPFRVEID